jgi:cytochrome bd-type quinol oxidase subunit 2
MIAAMAGQPVLPVIWACIMAFVILAYVVLDGFDLGVGMLFAVEHDEHDRDVMVNTIAPVWDGNETWLSWAAAASTGLSRRPIASSCRRSIRW